MVLESKLRARGASGSIFDSRFVETRHETFVALLAVQRRITFTAEDVATRVFIALDRLLDAT